MYLILGHEKAVQRNRLGGEEMHLKGTSKYRWANIVGDTQTALKVKDGEGLTENEKSECVNDLPPDFIKNYN